MITQPSKRLNSFAGPLFIEQRKARTNQGEFEEIFLIRVKTREHSFRLIGRGGSLDNFGFRDIPARGTQPLAHFFGIWNGPLLGGSGIAAPRNELDGFKDSVPFRRVILMPFKVYAKIIQRIGIRHPLNRNGVRHCGSGGHKAQRSFHLKHTQIYGPFDMPGSFLGWSSQSSGLNTPQKINLCIKNLIVSGRQKMQLVLLGYIFSPPPGDI